MKHLMPIFLGVFAAGPAFAHVMPDAAEGALTAGFLHPFLGVDHVLAMVMVGLCAARLGAHRVYMMPAVFVGAMALGFALAHAGFTLPAAEPMILASVVILGLAVALAVQSGPRIVATLAGFFGLFHGYAHGVEIGGALAFVSGLGFTGATILLHGLGIGLGAFAPRLGQRGALLARGLGGLAVAIGAISAFGV